MIHPDHPTILGPVVETISSCHRAERYAEINRLPHPEELAGAFAIADRLGLRRLDARSRSQALAAA